MSRPLNPGCCDWLTGIFHAGLAMSETGLGFDTNGKLSRFIWVTTKEAHGPYRGMARVPAANS